MRLQKQFGSARLRKLKGCAMSRFQIGNIRKIELHWYETHGIGKKNISVAAT